MIESKSKIRELALAYQERRDQVEEGATYTSDFGGTLSFPGKNAALSIIFRDIAGIMFLMLSLPLTFAEAKDKLVTKIDQFEVEFRPLFEEAIAALERIEAEEDNPQQ